MSKFEYEINGILYNVDIKEVSGGHARVEVNGVEYLVKIKTAKSLGNPSRSIGTSPNPSGAMPVSESRPVVARKETLKGTSDMEGFAITSPIPGVVVQVLANPGDRVKTGDVVVVIEAMKMENNITALRGGVVKDVHVHPGSEVQEGNILIVLSES